MNFEIDKVVTIDNDEKYLIADTVEMNSKKYLYLSALEKKHFVIARVDEIDGQVGLSKLEEDEFKEVLEMFFLKHTDLIEKIEIIEE